MTVTVRSTSRIRKALALLPTHRRQPSAAACEDAKRGQAAARTDPPVVPEAWLAGLRLGG
ncbi:hypothetical protein [Streptomyces sp. NPDC058371]|uniref:hypothetical protein n=1 Tax=Streptomyces sp. NPDC058371 TaxID=3346463 RepID=UPI0036578E92